MKNLFKLTTAALALVAFASCSDDELSSANQAVQENFSSVLEVSVEQPDGLNGTRAARDANAGSFTWQKNDAIRVYDTDLAIFDSYKFNEKFGRSGASALKKDPTYALFPADDVRKGYWDGTGHIAEIKIGTPVKVGGIITHSVIKYDTKSETTVDDKVLYDFRVPMWGTVQKVDESTVKVTGKGLMPLTGVLYLVLDETLNNASWIKLVSSKNLSGTFYANLDDEEPALVSHPEDEYVDLHKELYVDLRNVPSNKTILYIPVIAGVNDLQVYRTAATADNPTTIPVGSWVKFSDQNGYTFKRNTYKKIAYSYPMDASTPEALSKVMEQLKAQTEDLDLNLTKALNMSGMLSKKWSDDPADAKGQPDVNIYVPEMAADVVTVNLAKGIATPGQTLKVKNANPAKPFTGTFVINVPTPTTAGSAFAGVNIDLPKAKVVIKGANGDGSKFTSVIATELEIGDGSTDTDLSASTLTVAGVSSKISVLAKATVGGLNSSAATTTFAPITINGKVAGSVDTKGNVNIALPAEGEAITGTLTFWRPATATLKQGYVGTIAASGTLGEADAKAITVKLDDAEGLTAINNISSPDISITESKWSLKYPDATKYATYFGGTIYTATQLAQAHKANTTTTLTIANSMDMVNTPDWDEPFANNATAANFTIKASTTTAIHTIKNISYNNYTAAKLSGAGEAIGFVGNVATLTVTNITFDNVQFTKDYVRDAVTAANTYDFLAIGGIAGKATGAVLTNVTVNLADNFGYSSYKKVEAGDYKTSIVVDPALMGIGGLVGMNNGNVTLKKVAVKGKLIQGYTSLGGFIGYSASGTISADKDCKSQITGFKSNYTNPLATNIELNFARIAGGIGYVKAGNVTIADGASVSNVSATLPTGGSSKLYIKVNGSSGAILYNYGYNQQWVGFSGTEVSPWAYPGTVTIAGAAYKSPTFGADGSLNNLFPNLPLYTWTAKAN